MTQIDFYVGKTQSLQARLRLACKLVEKAHARKMHTYIHTDSAATSAQLDDLPDIARRSFMPHATIGAERPRPRILIRHDVNP